MAADLRILPLTDPQVALEDVEDALVERSREGDADAFARLYARYRRPVYNVCQRQLQNPALAEEVTQDTFERAFAHLDGFDTTKRMLPWLMSIAIRRCIDVMRRGSRTALHEPTDSLWPERGDEDATADAVIMSEYRRELEHALATLPPRQRRALLLYALEGWGYADIASAEGTSLLSVKSLIFRARARLRAACETSMLGITVFPVLLWRRARARLTPQVRRVDASVCQGLASATAQQFATGFLALAMTVGGTGAAIAAAGATTSAPDVPAVAQRSALVGSPAGIAAGPTAVREGDRWTPSDSGGVVGEITDPNREVTQPEDAQMTSIVFSPDFARDRTILASGYPHCRTKCPPVLFRSTDAGASWTRVAAKDFTGDQLLLPPGFPARDGRIFAMGPLGLQVSEDGGATFAAAVPVARLLVGSAAISPAFDRDDPRIVIGAQALMQYDDRFRGFAPSAYSSIPGPMEPAFSPSYIKDGLLMVGGSRLAAQGKTGVVFRCTDAVCSESMVPGGIPRIRFAPDFPRHPTVVAFNSDGLFVSSDAGTTFRRVMRVPTNTMITDVRARDADEMLVALRGFGNRSRTSGLYASRDGGRSWSRVSQPLFDRQPRVIAAAGDRVVVGLDGGVACSTDGGSSWLARCPSA